MSELPEIPGFHRLTDSRRYFCILFIALWKKFHYFFGFAGINQVFSIIVIPSFILGSLPKKVFFRILFIYYISYNLTRRKI